MQVKIAIMIRTEQRILIYEPNPILRRRFVILLCGAGFRRIRETDTETDAQEWIRRESFGIILGDGDLCKQELLRLMDLESSISPTGHAAFLYYTESSSPHELRHFCRSIGCERVVLPFSEADLCYQTELAIELSELHRRADSSSRRLIEMPECLPERLYLLSRSENLHPRIEAALFELGLSPHFIGYQYLFTAIVLVCQKADQYRRATKDLYPAIARIYHSTPSRVERSIRTVIAAAWKQGRRESIERYFLPDECLLHEHPSNTRFIAAISGYLNKQPLDDGHDNPG